MTITRDVPYYCNNEDPNVIRLFIIRHGQTDHNVKKILQGHKDTSINGTGIKQSEQLGEYLGNQDVNIKFDRVVSSDLKRCKETIETVLSYSNQDDLISKVEYVYGLRERYMGVIEGMHLADAEKYADKHGKGSFRDFGEAPEDFVGRLSTCIEKVVAESSKQNCKDKNVALVSHGGAIRTILRWLEYKGQNAQQIIVFNTSVTIVDYLKDEKQFVVRRVGNTQHLGDGEFIVSDLKLR
ncbi:phosphoglycerate mutase NDAI_0E00790 [Naumovozyma dairenensis CBS 421]|uniref:Phosphoglycerate mutase-like protein n=1 Tax=Naumovozyma dairenensis (strain ATCC 10597 / BCRC 20456 / CBS 421 / NBRC 0211 / NRRL Y-12639) TaxID=1071378 RepID=G0WAX5_NAUDC|nr:hypothetical protein NDAI_0E00790 [Naumovozyma dairenensis CBS 421]CCD24895.1 hypothetical protein NDAI_0E00790 [Naumovozyma dairenensis CBS 421]